MTILVQQLKAEIEVFQEGCRKLAFQLSAGGYNAAELTAEQLIAKVQGGLDLFCESTSGWVQQVEAERDRLKAENAELRARLAASAPRRPPAEIKRNGPGWMVKLQNGSAFGSFETAEAAREWAVSNGFGAKP